MSGGRPAKGAPRQTTRFARIARLPARRPRLVVAAWLLATMALALYGHDITERLTGGRLFIDGTAAKRAFDIAAREFEGEDPMVVMVRGPRAELERQGRALTRRLEALPRAKVVSPWEGNTPIEGLRPSPTVAALLVQVELRPDEEISAPLTPVRRQVDAVLTPPVRASIAGVPAIAESYRSAHERATVTGELIAIPVMLVVLLLVFRSVIAAIMPLVVGGAVVVATRGILLLLNHVTTVDLFALSVVGMMGLALGVDYSLLVVSRFREERRNSDLGSAVETTVATTARAVVPAGSGLLLAMLVTLVAVPGSSSIALAMSVVTALSMLSALCVTPALLMVIGPNLERWSLPARRRSGARPVRSLRRLAARPGAVTSIVIALLLCAALASSLNSGVATIKLLPAGDPGRQQQEEVEEALGPGWLAPMFVVVNGRDRPITESRRLRAMADFEEEVERDPGVETVAGIAELERSTRQLSGVEDDLVDQERGLDRLEHGLSRAHRGATLNTSGLLEAAEGSRALDTAIGAAGGGAAQLGEGLSAAGAGSQRLAGALGRADEGSGELADGTSKASSGAGRLARALERAGERTEEMAGTTRLFRSAMLSGEERLAGVYGPLASAEGQLQAAWQALQRMTSGRADPEYAAALRAVEEAGRRLSGRDPGSGEQVDPSYEGVGAGIEGAEGQFEVGLYLAGQLDQSSERASEGLGKLARASRRLDRGLQRLADGSRELAGGVAELAGGGERLSPALARLADGAMRLEDGLVQLGTGSTRLADGLGGGAQKSKLLAGGLDRIGTGLRRGRGGEGGESRLDRLRARSPGLFRSGYFVLAGLDGSRPGRRDQIDFLVNLDRGGVAGRMFVIPSDPPASAGVRETKERLEAKGERLARETGTEVVVGGVAPNEIEINEATRGQAVILRLALVLVSFLVLLPVVRSLVLALAAALLNLVAVSAVFGLLALLFDTSLLGGPGYIEALVIPAIVVILFGLAIDYEVFVFARIREEYLRTGSTERAIEGGLDHTAHIVTGAALIMIAIFLAFSVSDLMPIRNFGVALAIGVFLDAFVVRLVVIPALMRRLGRWTWWMPRWLDRLLPGGAAA